MSRLLTILIILGAAWRNRAQRVFLFERCPSSSCPIDCETSTAADGCPTCNCPLGQRCPVIVCPNSHQGRCRRVQRMDGCMTCVCNRDTFSIYDQFNNVETFLLDRPIPGSVARCQLSDIRAIDRCTRGLIDYRDSLRFRDPTFDTHIYPWFKFTRSELSGFCDAMAKLRPCIGTRMDRCMDQHPDLSYLSAMYGFPCLENRKQFFESFDCLSNVLAAHGRIRNCEGEFEKKLYLATKAKSSTKGKREKKCGALNQFFDCTRPVLVTHCGAEIQRLFRDTMLEALPFIAPECKADGIGALKAIETRRFSAPAVTFNQNPPVSLSANRRQDFVESGLGVSKDNVLVQVSNQKPKGSCHLVGVNRFRCLDRSAPQRVTRWYRKPGSPECTPYQYQYCGKAQEQIDRPIRYEDHCYDLCFTQFEQTQLQFAAMRFRNGFRTDDDQHS